MQNTILSLIDSVDQASAFAEYEVVSSLIDTYTKSMIISESVDVTQEASIGVELNSPITGRTDESKLKKILMFIPRLIAAAIRFVVRLIVGIIDAIANAFRSASIDKEVRLPINQRYIWELLDVAGTWLQDMNKSLEQSFDKNKHISDNGEETAKYVTWINDFINVKYDGHELYQPAVDTFDDNFRLREFPSIKIDMWHETRQFRDLLKEFDEGGKYHKKLFTTTFSKEASFDMNALRTYIRELKRNSKQMISKLNGAFRYVKSNEPEKYNEREEALTLKVDLEGFRSDIAYIMNFFTKISTKIQNELKKNSKTYYDPDEYSDEVAADEAEYERGTKQ